MGHALHLPCPPIAALALAGCAAVASLPLPDARGTVTTATIDLDGQAFDATWYWPVAEPLALLVLQPGFTRACRHLRETTRQLTTAPVAALCIDAPMAGGNPGLADALALRMLHGLPTPGASAMPRAVIVGGHSAGAAFAARLGARLHALAPERLAGALLLDPVATPDFDAELRTLSDRGARPVLAVLAPPHRCNGQGSARPAIERARDAARAAGRDTVQAVEGGDAATHVDAEGEDSDALARAACGAPAPPTTARLRETALAWLRRVLACAGNTAGVSTRHEPVAQPPVLDLAGGGARHLRFADE